MIIRENRTETVRKLVSMKSGYPGLKVMLALGGWGGCETVNDAVKLYLGKGACRNVVDITAQFSALIFTAAGGQFEEVIILQNMPIKRRSPILLRFCYLIPLHYQSSSRYPFPGNLTGL